MASFSEFINGPAGKPLIAVVAILAVGGASFEALNSASCRGDNYGSQVTAQTQVTEAQKAIEGIKANKTMTPEAKAQAIAHWQGAIDTANGKSVQQKPPTNP